MLQAKLKNGKMITPAMFQKDELTRLKNRKESFYCPTCKERVILRAGEKVIAHFAHRAGAKCQAAGEGAYHEKGKLLLYKWLLHQGLDVELELYLPEINQRPDFFLHVNKRQIAIEFQCSRISTDIVVARTVGYQKAGIHVIWVLGERLFRRRGSHTLIIDSFTQTMLHQFSRDYPLSLFYFCPLTSTIIKFQDIIFTRNTRAFGKLSMKSLPHINFPELLSANYLPKESLITNWRKEKNRFRKRRRNRAFGEELKWQRWLYQQGLHFEQLSGYVHLPVRNGYRIKQSNWIWQSRILYDIISPKQVGSTITLHQCRRIIKEEELPPNLFPLVASPTDPVYEYLSLLCSAQVLEQTSTFSFIKRKEILIHKQLDDALKEDSVLILELFTKNET